MKEILEGKKTFEWSNIFLSIKLEKEIIKN